MRSKLLMIRLLMIAAMVLVLASSVSAFGKIFVVSLNYNKGDISINDKVIKLGYYPDRKIQPEDGYICEIISYTDEVLYSFRFEVPLKIYLDSSDGVSKGLSGGYILLDNADFALVMPYFDNAKEIRIYRPEGKTKRLELNMSVEEIMLSKDSRIMIIGSVLGVLILLALLLLLLRRKHNKR